MPLWQDKIETVPRRGYRLIAPVSQEPEPIITPIPVDEAPDPQPMTDILAERGPPQSPQWFMRISPAAALGIAILGIVAGLAIHFYFSGETTPTAIAKNEPAPSPSHDLAAEFSSPTESGKGSLRARAHLHIGIGDEALRLGQKEQARVHFEKALALQAVASPASLE